MALEKVTQCPVCDATEFSDAITCVDYTCSNEKFIIQRCVNCNFLLTNPRPDVNSVGNYYESPDYISHTGSSKSIFDSIYLWARGYTLKWKYNLISKRKQKGRLLDYGCGTGEFLNHMNRMGWQVSGVEPSEVAREKASQLLQQDSPVFSDLNQLKNIFDIITLWHVLEHVADLNEKLRQLKKVLQQDGLIFVAVPNHESADAVYYKEHWAGYDVPRHLWHFSKSTMKQILAKNGFRLIEILPMKLDAYYVSLLSEKYRNNQKHSLITPIKAFWQGLQSNVKGKKNMNYSSLIYIARHA